MARIDVDFNEPDTFKTPDGEEWAINPLRRRHRKKFTKFTNLNDQMTKLKKENRASEANRLLFGEDEENEDEETILTIADNIIDLSIENIKTKEKLPEKYRLEISKVFELCTLVIKASSGKIPENKGDDTPLQKNKKKNK